MTALTVRRHDGRRRLPRALAWPACILLGSCGLALADPAPVSIGPGCPPAAADPAPDHALLDERLPDRPAESPPPPDAAPPDRPPRRNTPLATPAAAPADAADRPASPTGPHDASPESANDSRPLTEAEFRSRRSLNHVLYRDRRYRLLLDQAQAALDAGEQLNAFDHLLELTAADEDVFIWEDHTGRPRSARQAGRDLLQHLSPTDRNRFDRYIGAAAQRELDAAIATQSLSQLQAAAGCYPSTAAGLTALRMTAVQLFDCGRMSASANAWRQLITTQGTSALANADRLRAALAAQATGDQALVQHLLESRPDPITVGGRTHSLQAWLNLHSSAAEPDIASGQSESPHWSLPLGDASGRRHSRGTPPYHVPVWSATIGTNAHDKLAAAEAATSPTLRPQGDWRITDPVGITDWAASCTERGEVPASSSAPVVIGNAVITRESLSLVARSLATGRILWQHPCETDLSGSPAGEAAPFSQACAENSLLQSLSTDGQRVYFLDGLSESRVAPSTALATGTEFDTSGPSTGLVNRLVAIDLSDNHDDPNRNGAQSKQRIAWSIGGPAESDSDSNSLVGHFFLGVPVPVNDLLLVVTECRGQINLVGLEAATGQLRFQQGLALVDRPLTRESDRLRLCLLPACRDDLVIVPTPCGAVIAFNLAERSLRWTSQYRALDTAVSTSWRGDGRDHATLHPVQPVFCGHRVLVLPADSVELLAFDIDDGQLAWSIPRRGGSQILVDHRGQVILSSTERVACLNSNTGNLCWESAVEPLAGRGVLLGEHFLGVGCNGRLMTLDLQTGRPPQGGPEILDVAAENRDSITPLLSTAIDSTATASGPATMGGNLIACGECLIVAAPQRTAVYIQARALESLLADDRISSEHEPAADWSEIGTVWTFAERQQHLAELAMTLGDTHSARQRLAELVSFNRLNASSRTGTVRPRQLLRELLHLHLETDTAADAAQVLSQLAELNDTPADAARWQVAVLRDASNRCDVVGWLEAADRLASVDFGQLVPLDVARRHQLHPATIIAESRSSLLQKANPQEVEQLALAARDRWQVIHTGDDTDALTRYVRVFGTGVATDRARRQLARLCEQSGQRLAAESWLLDIQAESGSLFESHVQRQLLALERRRQRPASALILQTQGVREFTPQARSPRIGTSNALTSPTQLAFIGEAIPFGIDTSWLRRDELHAELSVQTIDEDFPLMLPDLTLLSEARRDWPRENESVLRLLNLGDPRLTLTTVGIPTPAATTSSAPQIELALIHRDSAEVRGRIILPARCSESPLHFQSETGNFLATAADGELHGLSLLDGARLWTAHVVGGDRTERLHVGPSGTGYCIVQVSDGVCCLDPVTGGVLWQRRDITPDGGLPVKEDSGLFGDEHCLVVVAGDQRSCQVLDTDTGRTLRTDVLPTTDVRRTRLPFGSKLFFVTGGDADPRFRLWDGATGRLLLDEPAIYPFRHARIDRHHVAYLTASRDYVIFNASRGEPVLVQTLSADDVQTLTGIAAWRDADCWYIQTSHAGTSSTGSRCESVSSDVKVPCQTMAGRVTAYAIRQPTAALWTHDFDNCTLLLDTRRQLPFLVTLHRNRDAADNTSSDLTLEVYDKQTGRLVAQTTEFDEPRILHTSHDATRGQYSLYTDSCVSTIQYELPVQQSSLTARGVE
ncbi:MAG: PQQ-binding-like beta-propeller repeat protein [Planctomycetaceae bacterium]